MDTPENHLNPAHTILPRLCAAAQIAAGVGSRQCRFFCYGPSLAPSPPRQPSLPPPSRNHLQRPRNHRWHTNTISAPTDHAHRDKYSSTWSMKYIPAKYSTSRKRLLGLSEQPLALSCFQWNRGSFTPSAASS